MSKKMSSGIIGLGHIINKFAQEFQLYNSSIPHGMALRNQQKAKIFSTTTHTFYIENTMNLFKKSKLV